MNRFRSSIFLFLALLLMACGPRSQNPKGQAIEFPVELTRFISYSGNPLFSGTDTNTWDRHIRERGWILWEDSLFHMWYTGYVDENGEKHLGYAQSKDGIHWLRDSRNPIYSGGWVEDVCVVKADSLYYMFAEGRGDSAHLLSSADRIHWTERGRLDIRSANGKPIRPGPFGTPTVIRVDSVWYLFYERDDLGIWLAASKDLRTWTNIRDEPVLSMGPEPYDQYAVAMDQVIRYRGLYYGYYHASAYKDWHEWTTNLAVSADLVHWKKYPGNPILLENKSSAILVFDGAQYRLYSMHDKVQLHLPAGSVRPPATP